MDTLLWAIPLLPLTGFLINGFFGRRLGEKGSATVGCVATILAFGVALNFVVRGSAGSVAYTWFTIGNFDVAAGLNIDALSGIMILVVTGIGSLIHIYSYGYMKGDDGFSRFFAYLNLFMFAMILLVLGDNLLLMFVGWEGVGLCSYLLIGFWYKEGERADAGTKAFIVNRVGDFGFLIGLFLLFKIFGDLSFDGLHDKAAYHPHLEWALLALFLGACGKSAQIPLYVWLPDAMAGPTPVSALIHAATMVTAGVYMVARLHFLFVFSPGASLVIGLIGALTALLAAVMAIPENNIKKVLAYSTISQLAFMFCGVGSGLFHSGIFHVTTHAFFKALLFLGAGAVIHALHDQEDMRSMGGLLKKMPRTAILMGVGVLAIAGFPGLSGFWSKEAILGGVVDATHGGHYQAAWWLVFVILAVSAMLTAFYMTRLWFMTFWGPTRADSKRFDHANDPHPTMLWPLIILAILSLIGGGLIYVGIPQLELFFGAPEHHAPMWLLVVSLAASVLGLTFGAVLYVSPTPVVDQFLRTPGGCALHRLVLNKFHVDRLYDFLFVLPMKLTAFLLWLIVDRMIVDGVLVHGWAFLASRGSERGRRIQSGLVNTSLAVFALGALVILALLVFKQP